MENFRSDLAAAIKSALTMDEVARTYGFEPNRAGYIRCPFHNERTASMKIYPGAGGFHCFGCGVGGSVIDFVMLLFHLPYKDAAARIDADFGLRLGTRARNYAKSELAARRRREDAEARKSFSDWREKMLLTLNTSYRVGHLALKHKMPDVWTDAEVLAVKWMPALEDWADALDGKDEAPKKQIFLEREAIGKICRKILTWKSETN